MGRRVHEGVGAMSEMEACLLPRHDTVDDLVREDGVDTPFR